MIGRLLPLALTCLAAPAQLVAGEAVFDSGGVRLRYLDEGAGTPVVLIHGYASSADWWREVGVAPALVEAGYRVVALDNRGHGRSGKPHAADRYGAAMVADIGRLLDHLRIDRAHLVGYSMGAVIANRLRADQPGRVLTVSLGGYGRPPLPERYSEELVEEIATNLERMNLLEGNDAEALACVSLGWSQWEVGEEELKKNAAPTLVVIGADDAFLGDARELAARLGGSTLKVLPGDHGSLPGGDGFRAALLQHLRSHESPAAGRP